MPKLFYKMLTTLLRRTPFLLLPFLCFPPLSSSPLLLTPPPPSLLLHLLLLPFFLLLLLLLLFQLLKWHYLIRKNNWAEFYKLVPIAYHLKFMIVLFRLFYFSLFLAILTITKVLTYLVSPTCTQEEMIMFSNNQHSAREWKS